MSLYFILPPHFQDHLLFSSGQISMPIKCYSNDCEHLIDFLLNLIGHHQNLAYCLGSSELYGLIKQEGNSISDVFLAGHLYIKPFRIMIFFMGT